jgi:molecular chaperone DnaK
MIADVEALVPRVQEALARSHFGKDAVQKAQAVVAQARAAIAAQDRQQMAAAEERLDRTLQLFNGLATGAVLPGGEA